MFSSKGFWIFLEAGSIGLFLIAAAAGYFIFPDGGIKAWSIFIAVAILHLGETPVGLKAGREKNLSTCRILAKTWLFGFTWWLPLRKGILDR